MNISLCKMLFLFFTFLLFESFIKIEVMIVVLKALNHIKGRYMVKFKFVYLKSSQKRLEFIVPGIIFTFLILYKLSSKLQTWIKCKPFQRRDSHKNSDNRDVSSKIFFSCTSATEMTMIRYLTYHEMRQQRNNYCSLICNVIMKNIVYCLEDWGQLLWNKIKYFQIHW